MMIQPDDVFNLSLVINKDNCETSHKHFAQYCFTLFADLTLDPTIHDDIYEIFMPKNYFLINLILVKS